MAMLVGSFCVFAVHGVACVSDCNRSMETIGFDWVVLKKKR